MTLQPDWALPVLHVVILVAVIYAAKLVFEFRARLGLKDGVNGYVAILAALAVVGLFHTFDLIILHLFPLFDGASEVAGPTGIMWSEFHHYIILLTVGLLAFGFAVMGRGIRTLFTTIEDREQKFSAFFDNSLAGISLKDRDGRYLLINKAQEKWFGLAASEVVGKTMHEVVDDPVLLAGLSESEKIIQETGKVHEFQVKAKNREGQNSDWAVTKFSVRYPDGLFAGIGSIAVDITARLQAEKKAAENGMMLRSLIDASPSRITMKDREGRFVLVNKAFAEIMGTTVDGMVGKSLYDCSSRKYADISSLQDRGIMESGEAIEEEYESTLPDGFLHYRHLIKFPVREATGAVVGVGTIGTEITDRRQAEESLRQSENQLRVITDSVPMLISHLDADRLYRFVNKTAAEWYGLPAENIIGKTVVSILGKEVSEKFRPYINRVLAGENVTFEDTIDYPDGNERNVRISYVPDFDGTGTVCGYFALAVDLTARREAEARRRESEARL